MNTADRITAQEHCPIPMPDGTILSARIWWPPAVSPGPHPAILEYIPYRKRDMVRPRDARNHPFLASHGYVCLRVDMRGSGDSTGQMPDMYAEAELGDARHVIDWIAAQPWCTGRVGMFGTSWGGTASLQAAVDAPGPLKAVLANCATTDRFEDDIHYMGGCLLTDSIEWGATLPTILAAPPDTGADWRALWQERLDALTFPLEPWIRQQTRGTYWRHGSVRFATERLSCPVLAIGGWADRYSNTVMPLVAARPDLVWGIVGPWGHHYPDRGDPGPAMGFQALALAWWDHWLKQDGGALNWPGLRVWRRTSPPEQGQWLEIRGPAVTQHLCLNDGVLSEIAAPEAAQRSVPFDPAHGTCAGDTGYHGRPDGLPLEQSPDDARALCFDSAPLAASLDLIGAATLELEISRRLTPAQLVCRLCDVAPDGTSTLITRGVLNLALDADLDGPAPFSPGIPTPVRFVFPTTAYRLPPGHRLRLALAGSYWPLVWPVARDPFCRAHLATARLSLPDHPEATALIAPFPTAERYPRVPDCEVMSAPPLRRSETTPQDGSLCYQWEQPIGATRFPDIGTTFGMGSRADYRIDLNDSARGRCAVTCWITIARPDGTCTVQCTADVQSTATAFHVSGGLHAKWEGETVATRVWDLQIPRT